MLYAHGELGKVTAGADDAATETRHACQFRVACDSAVAVDDCRQDVASGTKQQALMLMMFGAGTSA